MEQLPVRPGVALPVSLVSSDPQVLSIEPSEVVFTNPGPLQMVPAIRALKRGYAELILRAPDGVQIAQPPFVILVE